MIELQASSRTSAISYWLATPPRRFFAFIALVVGLLLPLAVVGPSSATAAPSRQVDVNTSVSSQGDLVVSGSVKARRRDEVVLYLARQCVSTVRATRRGHYVIASGRVARTGTEGFRATIAASEVTPKRGRACYLVADSRKRTKTQASAAYRMR